MFSRHDDFPLDWDPITVICGKSIGFSIPAVANVSWSLLMVLMSSGSMMPETPGIGVLLAIFRNYGGSYKPGGAFKATIALSSAHEGMYCETATRNWAGKLDSPSGVSVCD